MMNALQTPEWVDDCLDVLDNTPELIYPFKVTSNLFNLGYELANDIIEIKVFNSYRNMLQEMALVKAALYRQHKVEDLEILDKYTHLTFNNKQQIVDIIYEEGHSVYKTRLGLRTKLNESPVTFLCAINKRGVIPLLNINYNMAANDYVLDNIHKYYKTITINNGKNVGYSTGIHKHLLEEIDFN